MNQNLTRRQIVLALLIGIPLAVLAIYFYDGSSANAHVNKGLERITGVAVTP